MVIYIFKRTKRVPVYIPWKFVPFEILYSKYISSEIFFPYKLIILMQIIIDVYRQLFNPVYSGERLWWTHVRVCRRVRWIMTESVNFACTNTYVHTPAFLFFFFFFTFAVCYRVNIVVKSYNKYTHTHADLKRYNKITKEDWFPEQEGQEKRRKEK